MSYIVYPDGTIEVISYDEPVLDTDITNEFLAQWSEEHQDD